MSDLLIHSTEQNLPSKNDVEEYLPAFKVISQSKLLYETMEVVDLTVDGFISEFKTFLHTLPDRRHDVDAKRCDTKAKFKSVINTLSVPIVFLSHVRIHQDTFISELFRIKFSSAMVYGRVTAETYRDNVTIYQLDDGTAKVDVYYQPSANKTMFDYLNKLNVCEAALRRKPSPMNEESIPQSVELRRHLRSLVSIAKARCHSHVDRLKLQTQCFVIGRPFMGNGGNVAVFAEFMLPDAELGNSCELFWKSFLLAVYEPLLIGRGDFVNDGPEHLTEKLSKMCL